MMLMPLSLQGLGVMSRFIERKQGLSESGSYPLICFQRMTFFLSEKAGGKGYSPCTAIKESNNQSIKSSYSPPCTFTTKGTV